MRSFALRLLPLLSILLLSACEDGAAECSADNVSCPGTPCADLDIDVRNCGACGVVCNAGFQCIDGGCACPEGQVECNGTCTTVENDSRNCGSCGTACGVGEICQDSACVTGDCPDLECDVEGTAVCIDGKTDEQNCGACGNVCPTGSSCLGGTCAVGDLYAACFGEGSVVPLLKATHTPSNPKATGIDGPQSLALLGDAHLLALGSNDATLYVIDRATMQVVGTEETGTAPNQVIVRGQRAYVISSLENTVQVIDLANPADPATIDEVSTGEGTNPTIGAFDENGTLWVSLWLTNQVIPIDFSGAKGAPGTAVTLEVEGVEGTPYPGGVSVLNGVVYVALNNLNAEFSPAGNGRLSTVQIADTSVKTLIDLGESCTNPGYTAVEGTRIYVACTDSYFAGEVAVYDTATSEVVERVTTGGGPSRIALDPSRPGTFYVADAAGLGFFAIGPGDEGLVSASVENVCPTPTPPAWEFNADVLVAP